MHIGIFSDAYYPSVSGLVISIQTLVKELLQLGNRVTVITPEHDENKSIKDNEANVIRLFGLSLPLKGLREYKIAFINKKKYQAIVNLDFDLIHTHTEFVAGRLGRKIAKVKNIPLIHTYHTMYEDYIHFISKSKYFQSILRFIARSYSLSFVNSVDRVIFPTNKVKAIFKEYGFKKSYAIVPTGLDLSRFKKKNIQQIKFLKEKWQIKKTDFVLLYVGRISLEKGIRELVDCTFQLLQEYSKLKLLLVGDGPEKSNILQQVKSLGINQKIIFSGMVEPQRIQHYYHLSDLFINASLTETQGLTYIEALASGLPNLIRYDKNLDGVIEPGVNGFFWHNKKEFLHYFKQIYRNRKLYALFKKNAFLSVEKFEAKKFAEAVSKVYQASFQ